MTSVALEFMKEDLRVKLLGTKSSGISIAEKKFAQLEIEVNGRETVCRRFSSYLK